MNTFDDTVASDFGRFSLPIKGLKRSTRRIVSSGGAGEEIISTVDGQLRDWLDRPEVTLDPGTTNENKHRRCILSLRQDPGRGESPSRDHDSPATILQVARQPHSLIWRIQDAFVRFLVHAVARYYRVVSFTKESSSNEKLVHLLRPNMQSARTVVPLSKLALETPPTTEWEVSSFTSSASLGSDSTAESTGAEGMASELGGDVEDEEGEDWDIVSASGAQAEDIDGDLQASTTPLRKIVQHPSRPTRSAIPRHQREILSDIDSGAEVDEEDSVHSGIDSLGSSLADLTVQPPIYSPHPARPSPHIAVLNHAPPSQTRDDSLSRPSSPSRTGAAYSAPLTPPMLDRQSRETLMKARKSRDRSKVGWRMPELTFVEWVTAS